MPPERPAMRSYPSGTGSAVSIAGHPLHPMIVPFPMVLLLGALVSDIAFILTGDRFWAECSPYLLLLGIITGVLAGALGAVELLALGRSRGSAIGWLHGVLNVVALLTSFASYYLRLSDPIAALPYPGLYLSIAVAVLLAVSAWLGGELVFKHGIGVSQRVGHPGQGAEGV